MHISSAVIAFAAACALLLPAAAAAYTVVRDRVFPATVPLPQAAPGDALYVTPSTRPLRGSDFITGAPLSTRPDRAFRIKVQAKLQLDRKKPPHWLPDKMLHFDSHQYIRASRREIFGRRL
jgi:hypothetical protein